MAAKFILTCDLNVWEYNTECESFTVFSIDTLIVYDEQYYIPVYLGNYDYTIVKKSDR